MENTYVIVWKSKSRASVGRGSALFSREEAERTAKELNEDYPDFVHEPLELGGPSATAQPEPPQRTAEQLLQASPLEEQVSA